MGNSENVPKPKHTLPKSQNLLKLEVITYRLPFDMIYHNDIVMNLILMTEFCKQDMYLKSLNQLMGFTGQFKILKPIINLPK